MLLLPASLTAREANDTRRLLAQSMKGEPAGDAVVVDASNLRQFDSAALAVLLDCQRLAEGLGKRVVLREAPPKLLALARLYGVGDLLGVEVGADAVASPGSTSSRGAATALPG